MVGVGLLALVQQAGFNCVPASARHFLFVFKTRVCVCVCVHCGCVCACACVALWLRVPWHCNGCRLQLTMILDEAFQQIDCDQSGSVTFQDMVDYIVTLSTVRSLLPRGSLVCVRNSVGVWG